MKSKFPVIVCCCEFIQDTLRSKASTKVVVQKRLAVPLNVKAARIRSGRYGHVSRLLRKFRSGLACERIAKLDATHQPIASPPSPHSFALTTTAITRRIFADIASIPVYLRPTCSIAVRPTRASPDASQVFLSTFRSYGRRRDSAGSYRWGRCYRHQRS